MFSESKYEKEYFVDYIERRRINNNNKNLHRILDIT